MKDAFEKRRYVPANFRGRVSADRNDPGYENHKNLMAGGYKIVVFLNGVEQKYCVSADPEEGSVCRNRTVNGSPVFHYGIAQTEIVKGEVTVRLERTSP
ncbi:hypothetical protein SAMN05444159_1292 [Bradyrhizobium lablabi]|uniref:Uncharacterized protein n=1 Tax=Bradyrhizobium lablabi TaxID=722472 RepID=A0A1M6LJ92_9BRAD|nr:hypothetical protein [Bradyrhizobium lablabi]SHJ71257.1 hypothetical protein SAMN05444159_1292 [Bradyrhizobium lablabi]